MASLTQKLSAAQLVLAIIYRPALPLIILHGLLFLKAGTASQWVEGSFAALPIFRQLLDGLEGLK